MSLLRRAQIVIGCVILGNGIKGGTPMPSWTWTIGLVLIALALMDAIEDRRP